MNFDRLAVPFAFIAFLFLGSVLGYKAYSFASQPKFQKDFVAGVQEGYAEILANNCVANLPGQPQVYSESYCRCVSESFAKNNVGPSARESLDVIFKRGEIERKTELYFASKQGKREAFRCRASAKEEARLYSL